jgi:hypothetical protein
MPMICVLHFSVLSQRTEVVRVKTRSENSTFDVEAWRKFLGYFTTACPNLRHVSIQCNLREDGPDKVADLLQGAMLSVRDQLFPSLCEMLSQPGTASVDFEIFVSLYAFQIEVGFMRVG